MRTLAIGDIHGCLVALGCLMDAAKITAQDRVVFLGDYVDRGPNSRAVIDQLLPWVERGSAIALRGNHEVMMMSARDDSEIFRGWRACGGEQTLDSYDAERAADWRRAIPERHWDFLETTRPWFETKTHIFVHGAVMPHRDLRDQPDETLYWERFDPRLFHRSGKFVVCGHTSQASGWPALAKGAVCIDTGVYFGEWLTCLDVASGKFWQTNELGAAREGTLADLGTGD